jgi:hypothetical protein
MIEFFVLCRQDKAIVAIDIFDELIGRIPVPMTDVMGVGGGGVMLPLLHIEFHIWDVLRSNVENRYRTISTVRYIM